MIDKEQNAEIFAFNFKGTSDPNNSSFPSIELIKEILKELPSDENRGLFILANNRYIDSQICDVYPEDFEPSQVPDPSFEIKQKIFFNLKEQFKLANIEQESGYTFADYWLAYNYIKWFLFMVGNSSGGDSQSLIRLKNKKLKASQSGVEIGKVNFKWRQYPELDKYEEYQYELISFDSTNYRLDWFESKVKIIESILSSIDNIVSKDDGVYCDLNNIPVNVATKRVFPHQFEIVLKTLKAYARCLEFIEKSKEIGFSYLQLQVAIDKAVNLFLWFEPFYRFKELRLSYQELEIQLIKSEQTEKSTKKDKEITVTGFRCPFCHEFGLIPIGGKSFAHCGSEECKKQYSSLTSQKNRKSPSAINQKPLRDFINSLPKAFNGNRKWCECKEQRVLYQLEGKNSCKPCITEILSQRGFQ
jgi:hypothetical protein